MEEKPSFLTQAEHLQRKHLIVSITFLLSLGLIGFFVISSTTPSSDVADAEEIKATPSPLTQILVVDIQGAVEKPGVYRFESSFDNPIRIADVVTKAGGFTSQADSAYVAQRMNLAQEISDGMKIYVPKEGEATLTPSQVGSIPTLVNVNTATMQELETLKGIGKSRAETIVGGRPFSNLTEFQQKTKLPASVVVAIEDFITF